MTTNPQLLEQLDQLARREGRLAELAREKAKARDDAELRISWRYHEKLADVLKHAALTIRLYTN